MYASDSEPETLSDSEPEPEPELGPGDDTNEPPQQRQRTANVALTTGADVYEHRAPCDLPWTSGKGAQP